MDVSGSDSEAVAEWYDSVSSGAYTIEYSEWPSSGSCPPIGDEWDDAVYYSRLTSEGSVRVGNCSTGVYNYSMWPKPSLCG